MHPLIRRVYICVQWPFRCALVARSRFLTDSFWRCRIGRGTLAVSNAPTAKHTSATSASLRATTSTARTTSSGPYTVSHDTCPTRFAVFLNVVNSPLYSNDKTNQNTWEQNWKKQNKQKQIELCHASTTEESIKAVFSSAKSWAMVT